MGFFKSLFKGPSEPNDVPAIEAADPALETTTEAAKPASRIDFVAVLEAAGVDAEQRSKVLKAQELLRTLPADAPAAVKRGVVEAAFRAFDIPTQKIVTAASNAIDALNAFVRTSEEKTKQIIADGGKQVADLERQIREIKEGMARAVAEQAANIQETQAELVEVEPVLRFFEAEVAPPKKEKAGGAAAVARPEPRAQDDSVEIQWEGQETRS